MMDLIPTDMELDWIGLSRADYGRLNSKDRGYVHKRCRQYQKIEKMAQISDVMTAVASDVGGDKSKTLNSILTGESPVMRDFVINVVRDYRNSGSKMSIREFYNQRYRGSIPSEASVGPAKPRAPIAFKDRVERLAALMASKENRKPEQVKKTEMDVIKRIIAVADENKSLGLGDEDVFWAGERVVADKSNPTQFPLEALQEDYRKELIDAALKLKSKRQ